MIRPLPIRIEPAPDEAWHGYLRRAAAALGVQHPLSLLAPFLPTDRHATHGFRARRSIGIAARPETYERLGHHFHLEDHEIRGMFLERYATISSRWDAVDRERLDPLTHGEESTVWAPAVRSHRTLMHCPACRTQAPQYWALRWLSTCQVICTEHAQWLAPVTDWSTKPASSDDVAIQARVLAILGGDGDSVPWTEPETFISDLLIIATRWSGRQDTLDTLIPAGRHVLSRPGTTRIPDEVRCPIERRVAQNRTTHDLNFAWGDPLRSRVILDLATLPDPPHYAVLVRYREPPIEAVTGLSHDPVHYPELLPLNLYMPDLALACGDMPINRGRALCAAAVWQLGIGTPWGHGQARTQPMRPLAHLQAALEQAGRLEDFWQQITHAAHALTAHAIDYHARHEALTPETISAVAGGAPALHRRDVELWLHLHWACRRHRQRPESAGLLAFHTEHGERLEALASQATEDS